MADRLENESIVAIATPAGAGGIGVIRMSGPLAPRVLAKMFRSQRPAEDFESHRLYFGRILDLDTEACLDSAMAVWMRAPHSYTGEDVVEFQVHGGPLLLNRILGCAVRAGLRPAIAGEFTRRAFLNGKLDLLQAEAVAELIDAQSEAALSNARAQLEGRISHQVAAMRGRLLSVLARFEAAIDFPEEDAEILQSEISGAELSAIQVELQAWRDQFALGRLLREGVRIVLIGRPNVGKSSLLNRLTGEDRAIVHHEPGTTRDIVEASLNIDGVLLQFFDTAGIREAGPEVEREGIRRSLQAAERADLTLWVLDGSEALTTEDAGIVAGLRGPCLVVANKSDRGLTAQAFPGTWQIPEGLIKKDWNRVSAATGQGIPEMKAAILREVGLEGHHSHAYLNNARHRDALDTGLAALQRAIQALGEALPAECIAADLRQATAQLGALLGEISSEDILDKIFSDFCIGK